MIGKLYSGKPVRTTVLLVALLLFFAAFMPRGTNAQMRTDNILRLHIVANSDTAEDQRVKLLVRDAILGAIPASESCAEAEAYVLCHGKELLTIAEDTLRANGFSYGAQLHLGTGIFPDRTYDGITFPAGEYRALRVVLGRGVGQNFWCVLFPPLCIVTEEKQPLPAAEDIQFRSSILTRIREWRDSR